VGGGGARLTPAGERLLGAAGQLAAAQKAVLAQIEGQSGGERPLASLATLGLRTSMRNQLPCTVSALHPVGGAIRVELSLPDGTSLLSRITGESAELLGLQPAQPVLALCKAAAVQMARQIPSRPGFNHLTGIVTRSSPSATGGEMSLRLDAGLQLVGFAPAGHGLRRGSRAEACVDESGIVIAVSS
jgi:molybdate transport system regulatory protein